MMKITRTTVPTDILNELTIDAASAGFPAKRGDAYNSRWQYMRKLLALGRKYKDIISMP